MLEGLPGSGLSATLPTSTASNSVWLWRLGPQCEAASHCLLSAWSMSMAWLRASKLCCLTFMVQPWLLRHPPGGYWPRPATLWAKVSCSTYPCLGEGCGNVRTRSEMSYSGACWKWIEILQKDGGYQYFASPYTVPSSSCTTSDHAAIEAALCN